MRRMTIFVTAAVLAVAMSAPVLWRALAQSAIGVYIDGQPVSFDMPPMMMQGRVLVPLRGIFERLGATVDYDARTQHIVAVHGAQTVELTIGSRQARVNDTPTLLDVPAMAINGRTMVPLRFISEALGATVQWVEASRTILIGSPGAAAPPPPATPPPQAPPQPQPQPQSQTLSGRLVAVSTGDNPRIVVRTNDQDRTVAVTAGTAIFRFNVETNAGGSAPLGALRKGDQVSVDVNAQNQATKITATYRVPAAGKITGVNASNRTVTLEDGRTYVVLPDADITLDGKAADFSAIQAQRIARFSVIEGTNQAYEVRVAVPAAAAPPAPPTVSAPVIMSPSSGATVVGSSFPVTGKAQAGAVVVVKVQPKLLGQTAQAQTTAARDGSWSVTLSVSTLPFVAFPYVLSAVQIVHGTQSDPASVEVNVQ
jgi:Copper amine oxidase N-terminal domain